MVTSQLASEGGMDIRAKLKELKDMHDQGLITSAVYEQRQQVLLATEGPAADQQARDSQSAANGILVPKGNLTIVWRLIVAAAVILIGIWAVYSLSDRQTKDSISQFASQTGIGKQVIPWTDRAGTAARKLIELNKEKLATAIQVTTHPTGSSPSMANYTVSKLPDRILVEMTVAWKGGFTHDNYSTTVAWEIAEKDQVRARVTFDSALARVLPKNADELNEYFRTKVYPTFVSDMGGG
jgi:hypothetical protein